MSSLSDEHFQLLSRIHRSITTAQDDPINLLRGCTPDERQAAVGNLVWLYSHWPAASTGEGGWTMDKARAGMLRLRTFVHELADAPIALNPWQQHLLQHFERLAPFPLSTTTQDEIINHIWGPAWSATLDLRTRSRHFEVYDLARLSRDLGISLERVRSEFRNVQRDEERLRMLSVQTVVWALREWTGKVLSLEGMEEGKTERPGMVALERWGDLSTGKPEGEGLTASGRPAVEEKTWKRHEETLIRFGDTSKPSRPSPPIMIDKAMYEKLPTLSDIKPVIRVPNPDPEEVIDLCDIPDSPPRAQRRYASPPPSKSPPPIEPGTFEHVWEVAGRKRDEMMGKVPRTAYALKPTPPAWSPVVAEQQVFMVHGIDVQQDRVDADVRRSPSTQPTISGDLGHVDREEEGANGDSTDQDHTTSRSSTTIYASPLPGTSAASSPINVPSASTKRNSASPTGQATSSGHRKRSVASDGGEEALQKRFKGSEDTDISAAVDKVTPSRSNTSTSPVREQSSPVRSPVGSGRSRSSCRSVSPVQGHPSPAARSPAESARTQSGSRSASPVVLARLSPAESSEAGSRSRSPFAGPSNAASKRSRSPSAGRSDTRSVRCWSASPVKRSRSHSSEHVSHSSVCSPRSPAYRSSLRSPVRSSSRSPSAALHSPHRSHSPSHAESPGRSRSPDHSTHPSRRSRSPSLSESDSDDASANDALWRQVLSKGPINVGPCPPPPLPQAEPVKEEPNVEEEGEPPEEPVDASMGSDEGDVRIVDTCIANARAQLLVLPIGWEMMMMIGRTLDGEIVFHREEIERSSSTSAMADQAPEEDLRRFSIHADSLRKDVRLLNPGKQLTFKIARALDGRLKYSTTFQRLRDDAAPW